MKHKPQRALHGLKRSPKRVRLLVSLAACIVVPAPSCATTDEAVGRAPPSADSPCGTQFVHHYRGPMWPLLGRLNRCGTVNFVIMPEGANARASECDLDVFVSPDGTRVRVVVPAPWVWFCIEGAQVCVDASLPHAVNERYGRGGVVCVGRELSFGFLDTFWALGLDREDCISKVGTALDQHRTDRR